jgi:RIO kinase 1
MSSDRFLDEKRSKKLDRELQTLSERTGVDRKTLDEVFDKSTLLCLEKVISDRVIDILDFPISTGKEGNVFRGVTPEKTFVAVKIFRLSTSTFKHISKYIVGDPRFKSMPKNRRDILYAWTQKEFKNLERAYKVGVKVPRPITKIKNVLVMEYLGGVKRPAPMLKDVVLEKPEKVFNTLIDFITRMYKKAGLVHGDMSAFNVLMYKKQPYLIDLGQGVLLEHPYAYEFLQRDIYNIVGYFRRYEIKADGDKIYKKITGK